MAFFNGSFFGAGYFKPANKQGGRFKRSIDKRKQDDEVVLMAVLHSYMKLQERHYHVG